jgi:hypothetical protein
LKAEGAPHEGKTPQEKGRTTLAKHWQNERDAQRRPKERQDHVRVNHKDERQKQELGNGETGEKAPLGAHAEQKAPDRGPKEQVDGQKVVFGGTQTARNRHAVGVLNPRQRKAAFLDASDGLHLRIGMRNFQFRGGAKGEQGERDGEENPPAALSPPLPALRRVSLFLGTHLLLKQKRFPAEEEAFREVMGEPLFLGLL